MSENAAKLPPNTCDKSAWGEGAWQNEPDRVEFVAHGFACLMNRNPRLGFWCAYVGVPPEHPFHGKPYDDVDVDFHGGLTYADKCRGDICHVPEPGMPDDVWWLGGDFGHCSDLAPGIRFRERGLVFADVPGFVEVYRDAAYVRAATEALAAALAEKAAA